MKRFHTVHKGVTFALSLVLALTVAAPAAAQRGRKAPDFQAVDLAGKEIAYNQQLKECGTLLFFFTPGCSSCADLMKELNAVYPQFRKQGVVFLGVPLNTGEKELQAYVKELNPSFSIIAKDAQAIGKAFGTLVELPETHPEYKRLLREGKIKPGTKLSQSFFPSVVLLSPKGTIYQGPEVWAPVGEGKVYRFSINPKTLKSQQIQGGARSIASMIKGISGSKTCNATLP